ncbi:MAG: hypothetical protein WA734_11930 [Candidatus Acidiferrales bacterium]
MKPANKRASWLAWDRILPIGVVSLGLFCVSFVSDVYLEKMGIPLTATIINNALIGLLGGAALLAYEIKMLRDQEFKRAKERIAMIAELNNHVRQSLTMIGLSAGLEQRDERLRRIDEAMTRIDTVLTDLLPRAAGTGSSRPSPPSVRKQREIDTSVTPVPGHHPGNSVRFS